MKKIILDGKSLNMATMVEVAQFENFGLTQVEVSIHPDCYKKMERSRAFVLDSVKKNRVIYGITTGFGALSHTAIPPEQLCALQYNLIRSHSAGVGDAFSTPIVRMIMLIRINCLIQGYSGVNPDLVDRLIYYLNNDILAFIPQKGSVGASGDLAPLSHLALTLIGEGFVYFRDPEQKEKVPMKTVLEKLGHSPCQLGPKDGLALINGTAVMCALACYNYYHGKILLETSNYAAALSLETMQGTKKAYDARISQVRHHQGQLIVAEKMQNLLSDSEIMIGHTNCNRVQDPYSFRCVPQVHGASLSVWEHAKTIIEQELNAVTDNPLIFIDNTGVGEVISGGNFHGQPLAMVMDYMAIAISEIGNISERRVEKLMNPSFSSLPAFLANNPGPESGMMLAHVTMAALVSANKTYAHPASVDSIPTSTDKEDHVSMGVHAGLKLIEIIKNVRWCLAIELLCGTVGIQFARPKKTSAVLEELLVHIGNHIAPMVGDRVLSYDIEILSTLIEKGEIAPFS